MIGRISRFMTRFVSRWLPDPLIFAMLLTLLTFVIALWLTPQTPISMVKMWGDGFWNLLAFGMQMALIIVTGHALASSAPVKSLLRTAASAAKTPVQGVMLVTFFGSVACVINWGFGLVVGAMFAREVARRVPGSDYPLLIACAYIGFLTWGGGFSGSMPLLAATPGNPVEHIAGLIPVGDTLFSGFNIFITVALIVVMPFITRMMMPKPSDVVSIDPKLLMEEADFQKQLPKDAPPSERLEESRILTLIIGALGIAYLAMYFSEHGFNITINTVNLMFMIAGLLLHKTPMAYMRAISKRLSPLIRQGQIIVNVAKGVEENTLMPVCDIIKEEIPQADVCVLSGPSHAEEVSRGLPTTCVVSARKKETAEYLQGLFMSPVFRVYTTPDMLGVELGGALKNVIALAAGTADGLGYGDNTKAALITRGIAEMARLGVKMGAKLETFAGLSGIGDLIVTCASVHSRNLSLIHISEPTRRS